MSTHTLISLKENYDYFFNENADPRTKDWFLISSPLTLLSILIAYVYIVKVAGPRYMQDRKPFDLKKILAVYNIFQIIACSYSCYNILTSGWLTTYTLGCVPTDYSNSPEALRMANALFYVYLLKLTDLIETLFFVMRKKFNQVSLLHVYHHVIMCILFWMCIKYTAGGMASFGALINSMVHVIMYTYYFLALGGPKIQKKLQFWKKSLTLIQMAQFTIILIHALQALSPTCTVPKHLAVFGMLNVVVIYFFFYDFYKKSYTKKTK